MCVCAVAQLSWLQHSNYGRRQVVVSMCVCVCDIINCRRLLPGPANSKSSAACPLPADQHRWLSPCDCYMSATKCPVRLDVTWRLQAGEDDLWEHWRDIDTLKATHGVINGSISWAHLVFSQKLKLNSHMDRGRAQRCPSLDSLTSRHVAVTT